MSQRAVRILKLLKLLVWAALVAGGVLAGWLYSQGRQAGHAMEQMLADWPRGGNPPNGARMRLLAAAEGLREGDFAAAAAALQSPETLSAEEEAAAERFLMRNQDLRRRFLAATNSAQAMGDEEVDVGPVRDTLSRALGAAARRDGTVVALNLEIAESALRAGGLAVPTSAGPIDRGSVERLLAGLTPGFELARRLMSEGYTAAEKLLIRASRDFAAGRFGEATALISLAGEVLALDPAASLAAHAVPDWFEQLASRPRADVSPAQARAAVDLCAAMAAAETLSAPVQRLVERVRREAKRGQIEDAYWWATVALAALGMSEEEIRAVGDEG